MNKIPNAIFHAAYRAALKSNAESFRHGCVIYSNNKRILSVGTNQIYKTHPYSRSTLCTLHAEVSAIVRAKNLHGNLNGAKLFVIRVDRFGNPKFSKPCQGCMSLIIENGLKPLWT